MNTEEILKEYAKGKTAGDLGINPSMLSSIIRNYIGTTLIPGFHPKKGYEFLSIQLPIELVAKTKLHRLDIGQITKQALEDILEYLEKEHQ